MKKNLPVLHNSSTQTSLSKRHFLLGSAALSGSLLLPGLAEARRMSLWRMTRLHPVRFIGGLLFDVAKAVVVELAADAVVSALHNNRSTGSIRLSSCRGSCNEGEQFQHPNYKASTIILGVADYEAHRERQLRLLMEDAEQKRRMQDTLVYLRDERIDIRLHIDEYSHRVGLDTEPDDLFTLDQMVITANHEKHYQNLVDLTGTRAFDHWRA